MKVQRMARTTLTNERHSTSFGDTSPIKCHIQLCCGYIIPRSGYVYKFVEPDYKNVSEIIIASCQCNTSPLPSSY